MQSARSDSRRAQIQLWIFSYACEQAAVKKAAVKTRHSFVGAAGLRRADELLLNKVFLRHSGWSCQECAVRKQFRCSRSGGLGMGDLKWPSLKFLRRPQCWR